MSWGRVAASHAVVLVANFVTMHPTVISIVAIAVVVVVVFRLDLSVWMVAFNSEF
jgi:hypothetical protein